DDLPLRVDLYVRAVHGARRRAFKVHTFRVIPRPVARALEFVLARFPIGRAAQVGTPRVDHEEPVRGAVYPYAVLRLPLRIHANAVIARVADAEYRARLEQRARQKEAEER